MPAEQSIVLIHGAWSTPREWLPVCGRLKGYHLLVPSVPGHSQAAHIDFTIERTSELLAELIRASAKNGKAHVVGLSLGAHIGFHLASTYPDLVDTAFMSGYGKFAPPDFWKPVLPWVAFVEQKLEKSLPQSMIANLLGFPDQKYEDTLLTAFEAVTDTPSSAKLSRAVVELLTSKESLATATARTLVVAATKRTGLIPTDDSASQAKLAAEIMRQGNQDSRGVQHPQMRHGWSNQDPELFVAAVVAWIEAGPLPEGFLELQLS